MIQIHQPFQSAWWFAVCKQDQFVSKFPKTDDKQNGIEDMILGQNMIAILTEY